VLGVVIMALLVAAIVTLLSITCGGDDDQLTIGSEPERPNPTFDASISTADEPRAASTRPTASSPGQPPTTCPLMARSQSPLQHQGQTMMKTMAMTAPIRSAATIPKTS
jgi:hypothetical protein